MNRRVLIQLALGGLAALALLSAAPAGAAMTATKIAPHLCKVVGGGRFVDIPAFPGEQIDRRLIPDIRWMKRQFKIFITDGYSTDPVHAANGEHPIGLATDIVPNRAKGGTWTDIAHLAHLAEPRRDEPIMPWRWVGWNGDAGHGRGDHLHLSWSHSPTDPGDPARVVYTRRCPKPADGDTSTRSGGGSGDGSGGISGGDVPDGSGGIGVPKTGRETRTTGIGRLAPIVAEFE